MDNAKTQAELEGVSRRYWENRNVITRAMRGQPDFEPEVSNLRVYPGEKMGITSDGVHDNLGKDEITFDSAQALVAKALARQSEKSFRSKNSPDDITAVIFEIKQEAEAQAEKLKRLIETEIGPWGENLIKHFGVSAEAFDEVFGRNFGALIRGDYDAHAKLTAENPSTMRDIQALQDADDHIAVLKTSLQKQFSDAELKNILGSAYRELGLNLISDPEADS